MDYWQECVAEALSEEGVTATPEQIHNIAKSIEMAHDNYGMAHGCGVIAGASLPTAESEELNQLKDAIAKQERWEASTVPCKLCVTRGWVRDGWGRDVTCTRCDGKGRVDARWA